MPAGQPPTYADTDLSVLLTAQDRLLEPRSPAAGPVTITSSMWTVTELLGYLTYRTNRFLRETGLVVARLGVDGTGHDNSIGVSEGVESVQLPQNMVDALRLAFVNYDTSTPAKPSKINEVPREDFTALDSVDSTWETAEQTTPIAYTQGITQTLQAFLAHPPKDVSAVDLTFVATGATLTGLGVKLNLPGVVVPYLLYGLLADAYSSQGEANNPQLAQYCENRFEEGILLAKALLATPARAEAGFV